MDSARWYEQLERWGDIAFNSSLEVPPPCAAPLSSGHAEGETPCKARPPSHNSATVCPLGYDRSWEGRSRDLPLWGEFPDKRTHRVGAAVAAGPGAALHLNSSWQIVQHLPCLRDDSQASGRRQKPPSCAHQMMKGASLRSQGFHPQGGLQILQAKCRRGKSVILTALVPSLPTIQLSLCSFFPPREAQIKFRH